MHGTVQIDDVQRTFADHIQGGPQKWHNFENRLIFDEVKAYQKNCAIFWVHRVL